MVQIRVKLENDLGPMSAKGVQMSLHRRDSDMSKETSSLLHIYTLLLRSISMTERQERIE